MAKLTNEQKIEIYNKRKMGYTLNMLSTEYNINVHGIEYLVRLIDKNGFDVLRKDRNNNWRKIKYRLKKQDKYKKTTWKMGSRVVIIQIEIED